MLFSKSKRVCSQTSASGGIQIFALATFPEPKLLHHILLKYETNTCSCSAASSREFLRYVNTQGAGRLNELVCKGPLCPGCCLSLSVSPERKRRQSGVGQREGWESREWDRGESSGKVGLGAFAAWIWFLYM